MSGKIRCVTIPGTVFDRWTVLSVKRVNRLEICTCICKCGTVRDVNTNRLKNSTSRSCGCIKVEVQRALAIERNTTHGMGHTQENAIWRGMLKRCYCPNTQNYHHYGGRGIKVCDEWRHDFMAFYNYVGPRPSRLHSIDRFPNQDGNYEPGNVRWATQTQQMRNSGKSRFLILNGKSMCLSDWAESIGVHRDTITRRIKSGWSVEESLTAPARSILHPRKPKVNHENL